MIIALPLPGSNARVRMRVRRAICVCTVFEENPVDLKITDKSAR